MQGPHIAHYTFWDTPERPHLYLEGLFLSPAGGGWGEPVEIGLLWTVEGWLEEQPGQHLAMEVPGFRL